MKPPISGATVVAGVAGAPVAHSLSPLIHNAWLEAAGIDGVYVAFSPPADGFTAFARGLGGGAIRGLNVTVPFKEDALRLADAVSAAARRAGAANLLVFEADGRIRADNTDGAGLLAAIAEQAPGFDVRRGPVVILGAGGAARGAAAALVDAGAPDVRLVNRTHARAVARAAELGSGVRAVEASVGAFRDASLSSTPPRWASAAVPVRTSRWNRRRRTRWSWTWSTSRCGPGCSSARRQPAGSRSTASRC